MDFQGSSEKTFPKILKEKKYTGINSQFFIKDFLQKSLQDINFSRQSCRKSPRVASKITLRIYLQVFPEIYSETFLKGFLKNKACSVFLKKPCKVVPSNFSGTFLEFFPVIFENIFQQLIFLYVSS